MKHMKEVDALKEKFDASLDDDLNTADAIAAIFEIVKLANTYCNGESSKAFVQDIKEVIIKLCDILGLIVEQEEELLDEEIEKLIEERQMARKNKNFVRADEIRDELLNKGIILEDTR